MQQSAFVLAHPSLETSEGWGTPDKCEGNKEKEGCATRPSSEKLWQDRYYDSNLYGEKPRSEVIRYIHRNPVKRGLVEKPEDWPWSSFRHYATGVQGTVEIESQWTAFRRGNRLPEGVQLRLSRNKSPARSSQRTR